MSEKIYTIDEIKMILQEILKDEPVYQVILFGSYAREEANKESDIDFVIDTRNITKIQIKTYIYFYKCRGRSCACPMKKL